MDQEQRPEAEAPLQPLGAIAAPEGLEPIPTLGDLAIDSSWQTEAEKPVIEQIAEEEPPRGISRFLPSFLRRNKNKLDPNSVEVIGQANVEPVDLTPDPIWKTILKTLFAFVASSALAYLILTFPSQAARAAYFVQHFGKADAASKIVSEDTTSGSLSDAAKASLSFSYPGGNSQSTTNGTGNSFANLDDNELYIPKIEVKAPIIWDSSFEEKIMLANLQKGLVHYGGTDFPSKEKGNVFITGHSSYYWWDSGKYKTVFALLDNINVDDQVALTYQDKVYVYQVFQKKVVKPSQTEVLDTSVKPILTLMTCTPVGTSLNRLIVQSNLVGVFDQGTAGTASTTTTSTTPDTTQTVAPASSTGTTTPADTSINDTIQLLPGR